MNTAVVLRAMALADVSGKLTGSSGTGRRRGTSQLVHIFKHSVRRKRKRSLRGQLGVGFRSGLRA